MGKHIFKTSKYGKLDISITVYDIDNKIININSSTYDSKPTIKEVIKRNYVSNAFKMKIVSTPSCQSRFYKIIDIDNFVEIK